MNIGIDIDDTLTNLDDFTIAYGQYYDINFLGEKGIKNPYGYDTEEIFKWDSDQDRAFWDKYLEEIVTTVKPRPFSKEVIKMLKEEGNKIIIITARDIDYYKDPYAISKNWLDKNEIEYDKLITRAKLKQKICIQEKIDIFIDDNVDKAEKIANCNIPVLLYDNVFNQNFTHSLVKRIYSWPDIYSKIKKMGIK